MTTEAWQKVLNIIGGQYKERWPDEESRIIFHSTVFTYQQRITALTFLYGNLRDADMVYAALLPQIGVDSKDRDHAQRFLADLASGKYDPMYTDRSAVGMGADCSVARARLYVQYSMEC